MFQLVASIFPGISDIVVHNDRFRFRAIIPSDATQHLILDLQGLILFQFHFRDVNGPFHITSPRIVELQAQTVCISITEDNLYFTVINLNFGGSFRPAANLLIEQISYR